MSWGRVALAKHLHVWCWLQCPCKIPEKHHWQQYIKAIPSAENTWSSANVRMSVTQVVQLFKTSMLVSLYRKCSAGKFALIPQAITCDRPDLITFLSSAVIQVRDIDDNLHNHAWTHSTTTINQRVSSEKMWCLINNIRSISTQTNDYVFWHGREWIINVSIDSTSLQHLLNI